MVNEEWMNPNDDGGYVPDWRTTQIKDLESIKESNNVIIPFVGTLGFGGASIFWTTIYQYASQGSIDLSSYQTLGLTITGAAIGLWLGYRASKSENQRIQDKIDNLNRNETYSLSLDDLTYTD